MIINTEQNQISKIFKKSEMGIKVDGLAHQMMIDGIYSNKVNSVFREISTNARDSHIQAGTEVPFEITIFHSQSNSNFCTVNIQDFGMGMSEEEVLTYLCNLNSSSKRDSNDVVGCFGIGSKSVFSLTNTYTYECVKNGILTKLLLSKDKNGTPNFTHTTSTTDKPNSVLCSFAIEQSVFRILSAIYEELALFDIKPIIKIIKNTDDVFVKDAYSSSITQNILYEPQDFFPEVVETEHFYIVNQHNRMSFIADYFQNKHIACGVIGYKLDNYSFSNTYGYNSVKSIIGILPKFELGTIKFGVSREIVENTEDTNILLAKKFLDIFNSYPKAKEIAEFLKASNHFGNIRYDRESLDYSRERRNLLDSYNCPVLDASQINSLGRDKILFEYLSKDYFKNKFGIRTAKDLNLIEYAFNRNGSLFKLFNKVPPRIFKDVLDNHDNVRSDVLYFYIGNSLTVSDQGKLTFYSEQLDKDISIAKRDIMSNILFQVFDLKVTMFNYPVSEGATTKYVYSHKTLGSNTHLDSLSHKDINIIKISRTEDLTKVDNVFKLLVDLLNLDIIHLDDYKEINSEFCQTLKPIRKPTVRTETDEVVDTGVSENGLRLRVKHDKIIVHQISHTNTEELSTTCYEGDTALTSSQCYTALNSLTNNYFPFLIFEDFILKDPKVMEKLERRCNLLLLSEQSDPVEIRKILDLVKNNSNRSSMLFFDKVLDENFYDTFDDSFRILMLRGAMSKYHSDLNTKISENLDADVLNIYSRAQMIFDRNEISSIVSRAYFNRSDQDLIRYCSDHISEFEVDFLSISAIQQSIKDLSVALYSENKEESLPALRTILYGDNV